MKKVLCVLLTAFLLIGFSACNNTAKPSEPDSKPQSSSEQSSSDSEPEVKKELNQDLLSDIGLTEEQIIKKRGEQVDSAQLEGGEWFPIFKNGYGVYAFTKTNCFAILEFPIGNLFLELKKDLTIDEFSREYGITHLLTSKNDMYECYTSSFVIKNFQITINTKNEGIISTDSTISIIKDIYYFPIYQLGIPESIKKANYNFYDTYMIGVPENMTIEEFLNDPTLRNWGKRIVIKKSGTKATTGNLTAGDEIEIYDNDTNSLLGTFQVISKVN